MSKILCGALLCAVSPLATAGSWYWMMDNDVVLQTDGDYTNGLFLGYYSKPDAPLPRWMSPFADGLTGGINYWQLDLAQKMWTPSDLDEEEQDATERPYAGTLTLSLALGKLQADRDDQYRLLLGVVGPASGAEAVQRVTHKWFGSTAPDGWDDQIENTPLIQLGWERNQRLWRSDGPRQWDWALHPRVLGGNLASEVALGTTLSFGTDLDDLRGRHWNQAPVTPQSRSGWALFVGSELRYRLNDITLQGPRPEAAPDVDLAHWQGSVALGVRGHYRQFGGAFSLVSDSQAYREATESWTRYGRLSLYWRF
ncbi:lipid A deacylase LpxR family protein [Ferrimonas balearica]|uniref:lipid A deacylase LpxR family protein n=1 Tax=Ferrimonas balearica TaxID=44012 RepID=UPI001C992387|nr:lipid A deacylase LpxR family protein [Ferrimonas balearica]MBY5991514.1 lipid A deacylase LpxR family protein [Ferrimonas balearica]